MQILSQLFFILVTFLAFYLFGTKVKMIRRNIMLGRKQKIDDHKKERWERVSLLAFGQKKMFDKPLVGVLHLVVYLGFIVINIELLEIILDGILGTHRILMPLLGDFYFYLIDIFEILSVLVIISCTIFLIRRNIIKIPRLVSVDLRGWPHKDANYILIMEIILMGLFLKMNAADSVIAIKTGDAPLDFIVSKHLTGFFMNFNLDTVEILEKLYWWFHILGLYGFMNYLPYSKHLHIVLAFPNTYYASLTPLGEMENMPNIQQEVVYAMDPSQAPAESTENTDQAGMFGAKDVTDLSWVNILNAYTCTECGRCSEQCPANITGKKLSPRYIMMQTRDRADEIGRNIDANGEFQNDGKSLLHDYITVEELRACTTCNACVQACPVSINPLSIIMQLRRELIMSESNSPQEWNLMYSNIENNFAPWKFSPDDRDAWTAQM